MRIDPKKLSEITRKTVEATRGEQVGEVDAAAKSSQAAQADQVNLTHQARQIQRAHQALSGVPEVRQEKVAQARRKLAQGTLEIDAEAIARRIVEGGI
ncbi:MAG: flagellar biosynthesis anti-sigma factor FlgM [Armatimonadetes bacterium]|nr:flagellar biosynthesis anti-sigma factor FlgM [Armatimonadota bacterium]